MFNLYVDFPAIVTNCRGNVDKAFNTTLQWDWFHSGCHLTHNIVEAGMDSLKNHATNLAKGMATLLQEGLDRSMLLSFHCIVAQMICLLFWKNMCIMYCILAYNISLSLSLSIYIYIYIFFCCFFVFLGGVKFCKVHGLVYPTLVSHICFHVPTS